MFPSAEHPLCAHRNLIGMQRAMELAAIGQQVAELRVLGYDVDADRIAEEFGERWAKWDDDAK